MKVQPGKLYAVIGASRSGKSKFVQHKVAPLGRVLVWDIKGEYPGAHYRPRTPGQLAQCVAVDAGKPGVIVFTPDKLADFDVFCRAAQTWIKSQYLAGHSCALVIEETADVTSAGKAPDAYGVLLRRFLAYGVSIFAVTQRPAESDKTSIGNASIIHVCRVGMDRDRRRVAADTGLPLDLVTGLRADQDKARFDFVTVDTGAGHYQRGILTFPGRSGGKFALVGKKTPL